MDKHETQQDVEKKRQKIQNILIFVSYFYIPIFQGIVTSFLLTRADHGGRAV
jgi:hypothetical protein